MADDIARLGYEIDSTQARTAAGDLDKMSASAAKAAKSATSLGVASQNLLKDDRGRFLSTQAAAAKYSEEIDRLRSKYNPLYAASKQLAASQNEIKRALELGAITSKQASNALDVLEAKYGATGRAAMLMGEQMAESNRHVLNMGFQFQDIGMMMASGQNPLILAMQQGTQVSGIFNQMRMEGQSAFSAIRGGLLQLINPMSIMTIGAIAGGAALFQWAMSASGAGEEAKSMEDQINDLSDALDAYQRSAKNASMTTLELLSEYGTVSDTLKSTVDLLNEIARSEAQQVLDGAAQSLADLMGVAGAGESRAEVADFFNVDIWFAIGKEARELRDTSRELSAEFVNAQRALASSAGDVEKQRDALIRMLASAESLADADGERSAAEIAVLKTIAQQLVIAEQLIGVTEDTANATSDWEVTMSGVRIELDGIAAIIAGLGGGAIDAAAKRTEIAALKAGNSIKDAARAASEFKENLKVDAVVSGLESKYGIIGKALGSVVKGQSQYNQELDRTLDAERAAAIEREKEANRKSRGGGSGGGSRGENQRAREMESFIASLQTERETLEMWRVEQLDLLAQYGDAELAAIGGKNEAKLRLEQEYQQRIASIKATERSVTLMQAAGLFGSLQQMAQAGGAKLAKTAAIFGGIQATIASYVAATKAMAETPGSMFTRVAAYASVLATGLGAVAAIKSAGGSSGGGGTSSAAPASASGTTQQAQLERRVRVSLDGPDWVKGIIEPIMTQIYEQTGDGTKVIFSK